MSDVDDLLRSPAVRRVAEEALRAARSALNKLDDPQPSQEEQRKLRLLVDLDKAARESVLDVEKGHLLADKALLDYVDDRDVELVWCRVRRAYA